MSKILFNQFLSHSLLRNQCDVKNGSKHYQRIGTCMDIKGC